jgi:8-oxo-dGTP pyrophosphatase MutT (NUDIX family)
MTQDAERHWSRTDLAARLTDWTRATTRLRGVERSDFDLNRDMDRETAMETGGLRDAAVLVPLVEREVGMTVLLTQRTAHLAAHGGQIAFPGGRMEPDDDGPLDAALRETEEEIGLPRTHIDVLGRLDTYITRTGFRVEPFVAAIRPPFILKPDPHEVAEVFEVPLSFILAADQPRRDSRRWRGKERHFYVFPFEDRYIWGATAGMLNNLRELLLETD